MAKPVADRISANPDKEFVVFLIGMRINRAVRKARGDVGIWHETYLVRPEEHESLYSGMPPHGLGKAMGWVPAQGRMSTARKRLNKVPTTQETET